jgi:glyoxylase-like metal-dependent hydrolase (beta-lactamase superfamily II)
MPTAYLCKKCGTQYPPRENPPVQCLICSDDRQYIPPEGQQWTTLEEIQRHHANLFEEIEPGVTRIVTKPSFGIGQQAYLVETPQGNILCDCIALIDDATIEEIERRGGIAGIAISHAHYYTTMVEWSRALGNVPIWLHEANRGWVMRPDDAITYWNDDTLEPLPGITIIRTGGHFPGATMVHRAGDPDAQEPERRDGVLFSGDIITVVADPKWVTFMYSYPNSIPLDPATVRRMADLVAPFQFERIHDAFNKHVVADGSAAVERSADRYIKHILGEAGPTIG